MPKSLMRSTVIGLAAFLAATSLAQSQAPFRLPKLKGLPEPSATVPAVLPALDEAAKLYENFHESAIAALKAANQSAALNRADRAINFFLISARRDPKYGKPVYNLGVMCAKENRWSDAISFYKEAQIVDPNPEMVKLSAGELERVQNIAKLESTAEGHRQRIFDVAFVEMPKMAKDPAVGLEALNQLIKTDGTRWEAQALKGMFEASLARYAEAARSIEKASRLAPANRRPALTASAELARREAQYEDLVRNADLSWEKQDYEPAAKMYASAWEISPGRSQIGMQAATGFLMADQIPLAAQILGGLRQTGSPEYSQKATAMLKELGTFSRDALRAASLERASEADAPISDLAEYIKKSVGDLTSPQMRLTVKPVPPLLEDPTRFIEIKDAELSGNGTAYLSTESIFEQYRKFVPPAPAVPVEIPVGIPAPDPIPASVRPSTPPDSLSARRLKLEDSPPEIRRETRLNESKPLPPAPDRSVTSGTGIVAGPGTAIRSIPSGAAVVFEKNPAANCYTPCQVQLRPGRHPLKATLDGYRDVLKILEVEKTPLLPLDLTFELKQGLVNIVSKQAGLPIYLDGKKTGQVTPARLLVNEGEHQISIEFEDRLISQKIAVKDGDQVQLSVSTGEAK